MPAVLHSDLNSFYASVEISLDPSLRGKPVAVCGATETRHGIVLAKSEQAKKCGIKTGMVNWQAQGLCPDLVIVHPHYEQYIKYSRLVRSIYSRYTARIEPFGMDECWLDVTSVRGMTPYEVAESIRQTVKSETGLTVSIGVSFNKIFAKLGSDMKKPDAITEITEENFRSLVWPLAASELLGVGRATTRKLELRGIKTIGDLAAADPASVRSYLGVNGIKLIEYANGRDYSRVAPEGYSEEAKSVGHGITCTEDLVNDEDVKSVFLSLAPRISRQLREYGLKATCVQISVRDSDLFFHEYQKSLEYPSQSSKYIVETAMAVFREKHRWRSHIRSLTIRATGLIPEDSPEQLDLFGDYEKRVRTEKLERAVDGIVKRFGEESIYIAGAAGAKLKKDAARESLTMPGKFYDGEKTHK